MQNPSNIIIDCTGLIILIFIIFFVGRYTAPEKIIIENEAQKQCEQQGGVFHIGYDTKVYPGGELLDMAYVGEKFTYRCSLPSKLIFEQN